MQNTTNYNFNLPEGTDLWNYLTQTNPNFTALDTILKSVSDATVTTATEVKSGTAHAITRTLPDANVIRFTATGVWNLGDTMTIDGTPVTVVKPNGTNLQTGDYIIGSEVLGVLRATQFTVYVGGVSSLDASDVTYDNTGSGLTATDVQDAIDEVNSNLPQKSTTRYTGTGAFTNLIVDAYKYGDIYSLTLFGTLTGLTTNQWLQTGITLDEEYSELDNFVSALVSYYNGLAWGGMLKIVNRQIQIFATQANISLSYNPPITIIH